MPEPLVPPESQYCDGNGVPYAGGSIATYIPGTDTAKSTWSDLAGTALNSNPIILDAAGRALIYGTGDYRFVLRDAVGNLVYDQETTAVDTSTFATPASVAAAVQAETDRAEAAESNLQTQITNEVNRATAAENTLTTDLNNEIARAEAAEAHLQSQITALSGGGAQKIQLGTAVANSSGYATVTFTTAYTSTPMVMATTWGSALSDEWIAVDPTTTGFTAYCSQPLAGDVLAGVALGFMWIAVGT